MYKLGMTDLLRTPTSHISTVWKQMVHLQRFTQVFLQDSQIYYMRVKRHTLLIFLSDWSHTSILLH